MTDGLATNAIGALTGVRAEPSIRHERTTASIDVALTPRDPAKLAPLGDADWLRVRYLDDRMTIRQIAVSIHLDNKEVGNALRPNRRTAGSCDHCVPWHPSAPARWAANHMTFA